MCPRLQNKGFGRGFRWKLRRGTLSSLTIPGALLTVFRPGTRRWDEGEKSGHYILATELMLKCIFDY